MTSTTLFFYGTLRDAELLRVVVGRELEMHRAWITGFEPRLVASEGYPVLVRADNDTQTEGVIVEADEDAFARISFYELGFQLEALSVRSDAGPVQAQTFMPNTPAWEIGPAWSFEHWQAGQDKPMALETAEEYLRLSRTQSAEQADRFWGQIEMRAATRLRAGSSPSPAALAPRMDETDSTVEDTRQPYSEFFAIREDDLSFPRFNGTQSPIVTRACFIGGDAVTVLPWDPKTNEILLVRQWRHGPFCRGDLNPWTLEPVAGRIDPGETPEVTARRELLEETGLTSTGKLHNVAHYYPSPGAYSEFLFNFVIEADLSEMDQRVAGLAGEDEDIMSHVLPLSNALELIETGEVNTGPLIISLQWLALRSFKDHDQSLMR